MKEALNNNYKNIIIFEDDINILDINFISKTEEYINSLNNNFEVLFLGANHKRPARKKIMDNIYECKMSNTTFAYCINSDTMKRLVVDYSYKFPYDIHWRRTFDKKPKIKFYCIIPHLVNVINSTSTIDNVLFYLSKKIYCSQERLLDGHEKPDFMKDNKWKTLYNDGLYESD